MPNPNEHDEWCWIACPHDDPAPTVSYDEAAAMRRRREWWLRVHG